MFTEIWVLRPDLHLQLSTINPNTYVSVLNGSVTEYEALDQELDQLNSCLDKLENWNDSLHSRMKDLLENMQKTREGAQSEISQGGDNKDT